MAFDANSTRLCRGVGGRAVHAERGQPGRHVAQGDGITADKRTGVRQRQLPDNAIDFLGETHDAVCRANVAKPHRVGQGPQRDG